MKVLITGYEPFGGEEINPSLEAVKKLNGKIINGIDVVAEEMPVVWNDIDKKFEEAMVKHKPDAVILVGQAGGRTAIALERVAVNRTMGKDNLGVARDEQAIREDGENSYFSTLPILEMLKAIKEDNIPVYISNTAGLYLCNYIFYAARYYMDKHSLDVPVGFVHIPFIPKQVAAKDRPQNFASMDLSLIVKALEKMVEVLA
jgi:pyroglutamyl-peptidase